MSGTGNLIDRSLTLLAGDPVAALGAATKQYVDARAMPPGYIDGLKMGYISPSSISVTSGACYIQSLGYVLQFPSTLTLSGLSLTPSTFYHLYGYSNAGTPAIELVNTAPASPYSGTARAKTGDTSRRYIGSVKTDASGNIYNFYQLNMRIKYLAAITGSSFMVLSSGLATTPTSVSCNGIVPLTSRTLQASASNNDPALAVITTTSDSGYTLSSTAWCKAISKASFDGGDTALDSSQAFIYMFTGGTPTGGFTVRVNGYDYER